MDTSSSEYTFAFPVFLTDEFEGGRLNITGEVIGTAFFLLETIMITAGHVVQEIEAASPRIAVVGLVEPGSGRIKAAPVKSYELLPCDIAVLNVEFVIPESSNWFHSVKWSQAPLNPFDPVRAAGFPYGMHRVDEKLSLVQRAFQGHIVSHLYEFKPPGAKGGAFPAYEVSFPAPRGLSGVPLLKSAGTLHVFGVIIGNSESKMLVYRSEEKLEEQRETTVVEQYDTVRFGIAVTADYILGCHSELLGSSVREFLQARDHLI